MSSAPLNAVEARRLRLRTEELRQLELEESYVACAQALLRGQRPEAEAAAVLFVGFVEAAIAGDRTILRVGLEVVQRLQRYDSQGQGQPLPFWALLRVLSMLLHAGLVVLDDEAQQVDGASD